MNNIRISTMPLQPFNFYLFNVDHGQSAAARLPNGQWCIFDVGRSTTFSPVQFIIDNDMRSRSKEPPWSKRPPWLLARARPFLFLKATISHLHGDHIDDYLNLFAASPQFLKTVDMDGEYLADALSTSANESFSKILDFVQRYQRHKRISTPEPNLPNYGLAKVREKSLPVAIARKIGGQANSRVNNASIITRIDCYRTSILICGDMEEEAWEFALNHVPYSFIWRPFVSNIDILIAPHHGHSYSHTLMHLANPDTVLVSIVSKDESLDTRYEKKVTTRSKGHIHLSIAPNPPFSSREKGKRNWYTWR